MTRKNIFHRNIVYTGMIAAAVFMMMCAAPSFAAPASSAKAKPAPAATASQASFAARKKALLGDISARIGNLHQKQACIDAAKDKLALRECFNPAAAPPVKKAPQKKTKQKKIEKTRHKTRPRPARKAHETPAVPARQ